MSASPESCFHLTVEIVREIHAEAIERFGGSDGVRDVALLESAVSRFGQGPDQAPDIAALEALDAEVRNAFATGNV